MPFFLRLEQRVETSFYLVEADDYYAARETEDTGDIVARDGDESLGALAEQSDHVVHPAPFDTEDAAIEALHKGINFMPLFAYTLSGPDGS